MLPSVLLALLLALPRVASYTPARMAHGTSIHPLGASTQRSSIILANTARPNDADGRKHLTDKMRSAIAEAMGEDVASSAFISLAPPEDPTLSCFLVSDTWLGEGAPRPDKQSYFCMRYGPSTPPAYEDSY